ncbi:MAG TPA: hypothetical protein VGM93_06000, partial [Acidimicrobiales bacterium]
DGTVIDETGHAVLGGEAEAIDERVVAALPESPDLGQALRVAAAALAGPDRTLAATDLEVALLDRNGPRRCFRRLADDEIATLLGPPPITAEPATDADPDSSA